MEVTEKPDYGRKLTVDQVEEIRQRLAAGESGRFLAVWYGVSEQLISHIRTQRVWKAKAAA